MDSSNGPTTEQICARYVDVACTAISRCYGELFAFDTCVQSFDCAAATGANEAIVTKCEKELQTAECDYLGAVFSGFCDGAVSFPAEGGAGGAGGAAGGASASNGGAPSDGAGTSNGGGSFGGGSFGGGDPGPLTCVGAFDPECPDPNVSECTCAGCNATCAQSDCVCSICTSDTYCSNPDNCINDDECDPFNEGCICPDCAFHPSCN